MIINFSSFGILLEEHVVVPAVPMINGVEFVLWLVLQKVHGNSERFAEEASQSLCSFVASFYRIALSD